MTVGEYIVQKFQSFGITLSEAELLDVSHYSGLNTSDEASSEVYDRMSIAIAKITPSLLMRAKSVSENGFSMTWDISGIKAYYSYLCKQYGLRDEINTEKPKVKFL
jgi:hypothetical protein